MQKKVIIIGAAGRDFHNFNMLFRDNAEYEVAAFTAAQIPFIEKRTYPLVLAGSRYPKGIPIYSESRLEELIDRHRIDVCVMSYSDLADVVVMDKASKVNAHGADFWLVAPDNTMIKSKKPVIAVCAVRTGCGKSQVSRYISNIVKHSGMVPIAIRHPMPYGDLKKQIVERFETLDDLKKYKTTIEEREDYEPHIRNGTIVYSGVDYQKILRAAEREADIIIWDGGNNDTPFIKPDLMITVADPLRVGDELIYYPGETAARMADVIIVNKVNSATKEEVAKLVSNIKTINKKATVILANSKISVSDQKGIRGKRVLVIEDGPTVTHGGMKYGAATVAARQYGAREMIVAKKYAVGNIRKVYDKYTHLDRILPAVGYTKLEIEELKRTINRAKCDAVVSATPTDLGSIMNINKPIIRVSYELEERGTLLTDTINNFIKHRT
ncbi:MAG: GTPase [Candidatus Micrarchaeota archaeon]|nr:GTPase [Candidatus Micrarchaeota archaeon]MDE1847478.1 GTPase [Candidatus Micrarchaeota archaeon]MDE1864027.1 GTPase [Candidatus Micrarchaeota archaeon]